jgi:hypothetical protein
MNLYAVEIKFPNSNADFIIRVRARSEANAMWVASEAKVQRGMGMGQIGKISKVKGRG